MRDELESLVSAGKIERRHVEPLLALIQCGFCQHRGWGFGRIRQVDPVFGRFVIDFANKPGHAMDLAFAAELLRPIPANHILARKAEDLAGLRQMAALHHLEVIKLVLQSFGGRATTDQIQAALVPEVITSDWKKWWEAARREMKKDGHFVVPLKKAEPVVYQAAEITLQARLLEDFRAAKGLKAHLALAAEIHKSLEDLADRQTAAAEIVTTLNTEILSHQRTMPALALEAIFIRDDLRTALGLPAPEGELTPAVVWNQVEDPSRVLEQVSGPKHKRALLSFRDAQPERWHRVLLAALNHVSAKLCTECARLLVESGQLAELKDRVMRLVSQHGASTELLLWLAKERGSDQFADILGPEVFRAMLSAIERDQFQEKKSRRLHDFIMDDHELLVELIQSADIEVIKDLTRALQFSPSFDDMDKRSLLARIVKHFPAVHSLISGEHARQESALTVSWESLERRRQEYHELVEKKIPANSKDIAIARSYGDLRENHEYKAAKEQHRLLMLRKVELEQQLLRARGTDFSDVPEGVVAIGTRVRVTELGRQREEIFAILGAWDFDADQHVVGYLSPLAQSLLGKKVGEEAELELDGQTARYRIEAIERHTPAKRVAVVPSAPAVGTAATPGASEPPSAEEVVTAELVTAAPGEVAAPEPSPAVAEAAVKDGDAVVAQPPISTRSESPLPPAAS